MIEIVGHTLYAVLGARTAANMFAAVARRQPLLARLPDELKRTEDIIKKTKAKQEVYP